MKNFSEELNDIRRFYESDEFKNKINNIRSLFFGKPLILHGAGELGFKIASVLKYHDIDITCFFDNNREGICTETGLEIVPPYNYADANIIICSLAHSDAIKRHLNALGISNDRIFCNDKRRFSNKQLLNIPEMTFQDIEKHISGYQRSYDLFKEDKSKQIFIERIKWYLFSSSITHSPPNNQYFDPEIINLTENEVFVDGGIGRFGSATKSFLEFVNNQYDHCYGFEPDINNFTKVQRIFNETPDFTLTNKGLWGNETLLNFKSGFNSSSKLDDLGREVEVTSLDTFFSDKNPPTLIKLDVEGAEFCALEGTERIIKKHKPKLAICVYHKPEDLYTLPELVKSYRDDYRFYLRHYTDAGHETVFYAI